MVLEQLVTTAGMATTQSCVKKLIQWEEKRRGDEEEQSLGGLNVYFYEERKGKEPVKTHVKALVVDGEVLVLGSANADRASWWTSQEVNVAVLDEGVAGMVEGRLREEVRGRGYA